MYLNLSIYHKLKNFFNNRSFNFILLAFTIIYALIHIDYLINEKFSSIDSDSFYISYIFHLFVILFYLIVFFFKYKHKISLKNKLFSELNKYILGFYLFGVVFYITFTYLHFNLSLLRIRDNVIDYALLLIFILYLMYFLIGLALEKFLFNRFEKILNEMEVIRNGKISNRISIEGVDELDRVFYFVNDLLDELEKKINFEKNFSLVDPLTKCFNRRGLDLNFKNLKNSAIRDKYLISILMVDLDDFKKINDSYGHDLGDVVLVEFINIIKDNLRPSDSVYRLGGEEFLIIFPELNKTNSRVVLSRLNREVKNHMAKKIPKIKRDITFSGGYVNSKDFKISDSNVLDLMIKKADKLLYKSKKYGKNMISYK